MVGRNGQLVIDVYFPLHTLERPAMVQNAAIWTMMWKEIGAQLKLIQMAIMFSITMDTAVKHHVMQVKYHF